jgi:thiol-disulfide isomerase/thioredoxin
MIAPLLAEQEKQYPNIQFVEVDVDTNKEIAEAYQITAMPTMVFFQSEKEVQRVRGANPPEIIKAVQSLGQKKRNVVRNGVSERAPSSAAVE